MPFLALVGLLFGLTSCGSYQYVGENGQGSYQRYETGVEYAQETPQVASNSSYYQNYFKEKSLEYESYEQEDEIFTDVDSYEGSYNAENDSLNVEYASYGGWGQNSSEISINVYPSYNWYRPWYAYGYGYYSWGWGYGWGYPNYGWGYPYYGGGYYAWGYPSYYCPPHYGGYYNYYRGGYYGNYTCGRRGASNYYGRRSSVAYNGYGRNSISRANTRSNISRANTRTNISRSSVNNNVSRNRLSSRTSLYNSRNSITNGSNL